MAKTNNYSEGKAKRLLAKYFHDTDVVTREKIFEIGERVGKAKDVNDHWLHNLTWILNRYDFVESQKTLIDGRVITTAIYLTPAGKAALAQLGNTPATPTKKPEQVALPMTRQITLQTITDDVDEFNRQNPSWELELIPRRVRKESL